MNLGTHEFKGFDDPIAIFRTGDHVDSSGKKVSITEAHLDEMIENFEADTIPYVIGHPEDDAPAYGWSDGLFKKDGQLFTKSVNVNEEFQEGVEKGSYRNRSVSIAKNASGQYYVRHVGFLGAAAPAVKGLKKMEFKDATLTHTFCIDENKGLMALRNSGWALGAVGRLLRSWKNALIEKEGVEKADEQIPEYELESISSSAEAIRDISLSDVGHVYSHPGLQDASDIEVKPTTLGEGNSMGTFTEEQVKEREAEAAQAAEQKVRAEVKHDSDCQKFAEQLEEEGKILPAQIPAFAEFLKCQDAETVFKFTEGEGEEAKEVETNQFERAKALFTEMPASYKGLKQEQVTDENAPSETGVGKFSAPDGMAVDPEQSALVEKAHEFQAKNPGTSFIDAVKAVSE